MYTFLLYCCRRHQDGSCIDSCARLLRREAVGGCLRAHTERVGVVRCSFCHPWSTTQEEVLEWAPREGLAVCFRGHVCRGHGIRINNPEVHSSWYAFTCKPVFVLCCCGKSFETCTFWTVGSVESRSIFSFVPSCYRLPTFRRFLIASGLLAKTAFIAH